MSIRLVLVVAAVLHNEVDLVLVVVVDRLMHCGLAEVA